MAILYVCIHSAAIWHLTSLKWLSHCSATREPNRSANLALQRQLENFCVCRCVICLMWGIYQKVRTQRDEESVFDEVIWPVNGEFDGIFLQWSVLMILWNTFLSLSKPLYHTIILICEETLQPPHYSICPEEVKSLPLCFFLGGISCVKWQWGCLRNVNTQEFKQNRPLFVLLIMFSCQTTHKIVVPRLIITHKELNHSGCCQHPSRWGWTGSVFNNTG